MSIPLSTDSLRRQMTTGVTWAFAERLSAQLVSTIVTIILARLLSPDNYGLISIVYIFITFLNIFVTEGFGKALVQKKDADELDFNSMFYASLSLSIVLYILMVFAAPYIETFFRMNSLALVIRVLGIQLIMIS